MTSLPCSTELFDLNPICGVVSVPVTDTDHNAFMCDEPLSGRYLTFQSYINYYFHAKEVAIYRSGEKEAPHRTGIFGHHKKSCCTNMYCSPKTLSY